MMKMPPPAVPLPNIEDSYFDFVISCIDPRFTFHTGRHMASLGRDGRYSEFQIAGGALAVVDADRPAWATALWDNLALTVQLHGVTRVVLMGHAECAAVNQWADRQPQLRNAPEATRHQVIFATAEHAIISRFPSLAVQCRFMAMDGQVTNCACQGAASLAFPSASAGAGLGRSTTMRNRERFGELVKAATRRAVQDPAEEARLLSRGVTDYGLSAAEAREVYFGLKPGDNPVAAHRLEVELGTFLRARASKQAQIRKADFDIAVNLAMRLSERPLTRPAAEALVEEVMGRLGLKRRGFGAFRF